MSLPVKSATQPSGVVNRRMHLNLGFSPISNQCVVLAGTLIKSPCSHNTAYTLSVDMQVKQAATLDKKAHFKIGMDVFRQKLLPERGFVRMIGI